MAASREPSMGTLGDDVLIRPATAMDLATLTHMTDWCVQHG